MAALKESRFGVAKRVQYCAIAAWVVVLVAGLLSWGARVLGLGLLSSSLMVVVWVAGIAFVICFVALMLVILPLLAKQARGRNNGA